MLSNVHRALHDTKRFLMFFDDDYELLEKVVENVEVLEEALQSPPDARLRER
jgi:hypothetical protein